MIYFLLIASVSYALMQFFEVMSLGSRVAGKLTNRLALGTTLQHSVLMASRIFLPPLLLSISFMIESGLNIELYLLMSLVMIVLAFITSVIVLIKFNYFQQFFQHLLIQYQFSSIPVAIFRIFVHKKVKPNYVEFPSIFTIKYLPIKKVLTAAFAYAFLTTGFLIAISIAILIPDYRMTVSHLASLFHGLGGFILALYIDPMVSRSLDVEFENTLWVENIYAIFIGRLIAYIFSTVGFLIAFYIYK